MRLGKLVLITALLLCCHLAEAAGKGTLLYVPMDNRPVCLSYTVNTMRQAGWDVLLPPLELLADEEKAAQPEAIFQWLETHAEGSLAVVVSSDTLLYGGLVASRTHNLPFATLAQRAQRLINLKHNYRGQEVYVFTTIMRSPLVSAAPVEPAYYQEWGPRLFRLGALEDKEEFKELRHGEGTELKRLRKTIPQEILDDLYQRRAANIKATELLLHGVESGDFDYLLIGRDDTAPHSQAHREARKMEILVNELPKERIRFFAGADQLGLLLLVRAANQLQMELPFVQVLYAPGKGGETVPVYEDEKLSASAKAHIFAAGAVPVSSGERADYVLALNTPQNGRTYFATHPDNTAEPDRATRAFVKEVKTYLNQGRPVMVADVKYGNGADNGLVPLLFQEGVAYRLSAYSGWNTAGNSLGFALAQGLLRPLLSQEQRETLLQQRYLDDWAYQSNARLTVAKEVVWPQHWPNSGLNTEQKQQTEAAIRQEVAAVAQPLLGREALRRYHITLPWSRLFEVDVEPLP